MPIHHLPNGKWKWGDHGKEYDTRAEAVAQAQAAYAHGYREEEDKKKKSKEAKDYFSSQTPQHPRDVVLPHDQQKGGNEVK